MGRESDGRGWMGGSLMGGAGWEGGWMGSAGTSYLPLQFYENKLLTLWLREFFSHCRFPYLK